MTARTLLIWLAIPSFIVSFYATSDRLLIIAGQANVALVVTASVICRPDGKPVRDSRLGSVLPQFLPP